ncbi:Putative cell cycle regulator [Sodalis praecaptivus]|uniref:Putative cell cycle regulator n=1 Tax=Sodalis praecaptivus TaxID=1239307 RepID=W0I268_9GAMM|nr:Putative cell cycle regulator [Sodalis praecaptivus]
MSSRVKRHRAWGYTAGKASPRLGLHRGYSVTAPGAYPPRVKRHRTRGVPVAGTASPSWARRLPRERRKQHLRAGLHRFRIKRPFTRGTPSLSHQTPIYPWDPIAFASEVTTRERRVGQLGARSSSHRPEGMQPPPSEAQVGMTACDKRWRGYHAQPLFSIISLK